MDEYQVCKEKEINVNCNRHDKKFLLARRLGANRCLLPDGQVSELNLFPLALEADMAFFHPVRGPVLQHVVDIGRDNSLFHRDAHGSVYSLRSEPPNSTKSPARPAANWHSIPLGNGFNGSSISTKTPLLLSSSAHRYSNSKV